jgi:predicted XRE-type DNA-binding protein
MHHSSTNFILFEKIISDMELQLFRLLPNDEQRELAIKVSTLLQTKHPLSQKQIALALRETTARISRLITKLNNNLTVQKRGKGTEWFISLK